MALNDPRVITPLPNDMLVEIEDFRYSARLPSRAEAIRALLAEALAARRKVVAALPGKRRGRPPKAKAATDAEVTTGKRRGRPPKAVTETG